MFSIWSAQKLPAKYPTFSFTFPLLFFTFQSMKIFSPSKKEKGSSNPSSETDRAELIRLYKSLVTPRLIEKRMISLLRQGKISKWFSGWGQEAISVGVAEALEQEDTILTMHRNLGVFTARGVRLNQLFAQFLGKKEGFTQGRDRSFHFGTKEHNIIGMISHLGAQMGVADGVGLANKLNKKPSIAAVFTGDGGASQGEFHEAINVAAVWDLPVLFIVENNGWGLSTPSKEQFACSSFQTKGIGYGISASSIDGNNYLEVIAEVKKIAEKIRKTGKPHLLEMKTFRIRGHEEASGTKYYPKGLIEQWEEKDPVVLFEKYLEEVKLWEHHDITEIHKEINHQIKDSWDEAVGYPTTWDHNEVADVQAPWSLEDNQTKDSTTKLRLIDAIQNALDLALEKHPNLVLMGQDIADYGGVFKATEGLMEKYGKDRVRNTPLCEGAILGASLGLSYAGKKSMVEMQFADFVTCGFNQIVNNLAKSHYRWGLNADTVIRMPTGAGVAAGPYHSQSNEAWFLKVPGLEVYYPSTPEDAKGLLLAAFENPNPVLFFEHKKLYRSTESDVHEGYYTVEPGKANIVRSGNKLTIITYGMGVHWALQLEEKLDVEIIDLRTLAPLDTETIYQSVQKTGRALILQEDTQTMGLASELSSLITENCFENLDAPVRRLGSIDTPIPFNAQLEQEFLPEHKLLQTVTELLEY